MATLAIFGGYIASGKSTKAKEIALLRNAIFLSIDDWVLRVGHPVNSLEDYDKYYKRCLPIVIELSKDLLEKSTSVVWDFGGNNETGRQMAKDIIESANCNLELFMMMTPKEISRERLIERTKKLGRGQGLDHFEVHANKISQPNKNDGFKVIEIHEY